MEGEYPSWVKTDVKFWLYYYEGNPNNQVFHIRGFVDDMVIVRYWRPRKQRWEYAVKDWIFFHVIEKNIFLTRPKPISYEEQFTPKVEQQPFLLPQG